MRLWSIHPKYLDRYGLLGLWREALLAQKVLEGRTRGYRNHPQLERFRATEDPLLYIGTYLYYVLQEGVRRGYNFDGGRILRYDLSLRLPVTEGQLKFEFDHLLAKLRLRDPARYEELRGMRLIEPHPLFYAVPGGVEPWERAAGRGPRRPRLGSPEGLARGPTRWGHSAAP